jgi:8-oxo-dGTP pyrophosphatase MutT (NUDIX family)
VAARDTFRTDGPTGLQETRKIKFSEYLRRILLREPDLPGGNAPGLIGHVVSFALDAGHHMLCEGILYRDLYGDMLDQLRRAHAGTTDIYYLDLPLAETLRRHTGRPQATEFTADDVRRWYRPHDLLGVPGEQVLDEHATLDDVVNRIVDRLPSAAHRRVRHARSEAGRDPASANQTSAAATEPSRRRTAATVLFTDPDGCVLIVKPTYKPGWELSVAVERDESPAAAVVRELREELGLHITPGPLLAVDNVPASPRRTEGLITVFDGGALPPNTPIVLPPDELADHEFVHPDHFTDHLPALQARRTVAALAARHHRSTVYLEDGRPPSMS